MIGGQPVAAEISADALDALLAGLQPQQETSPYLHGWRAAADYLGVGASTLKHSPDVPRRKRDGVVLFRRDELDAWVDDHYEGASRYRNGSRTVPYREAQGPRHSLRAKKNPA